MNDNLVSIVIPVYNSEKYIQDTIDSVKKQTYKNWELILIDDNSEDKSYQIIEKNLIENKIILIKNTKNKGPAYTRNLGIQKAKGRYISFLDSDDIWNEYKLEKQLNFMKEKNIAFSYTGYQYLNIEKRNKTKSVEVPYLLEYSNALKQMKIATGTVILDSAKIPKKIIDMPNINGAEDAGLWFKIMKNGYNAYGLNENLMTYVIHKNSLSYNKFKSCKKRWILYRKFEKISIIKSLYYLINYGIYAIIKRKF